MTIYKPTDLNQLWGNFFDLNTSYGLHVDSNGTISIDSAAATDNFDTGVYLDNPTFAGVRHGEQLAHGWLLQLFQRQRR